MFGINGFVDKPNEKNYNKATISERLSNGEISSKIHIGRQKKHIEGTKEYFDKYKDGSNPQSILTVSINKAQELIDKYAGSGKEGKKDRNGVWTEFITADEFVGKYSKNGKYYDTKRFSVHYSKKGAHIVPVEPLEEIKNG